MRTVRQRRRRSVAGVAVVAVLAVGGVAGPQWLPDAVPGPATDVPGAARLDASALEAATAGWIEGWTSESEYALGSSNPPVCLTNGSINVVQATSGGISAFSEMGGAGTEMLLYAFDDRGTTERAWKHLTAWVATCPLSSSDVGGGLPTGTELRHARDESGLDVGQAVTDVWLARAGNRVAVMRTTTDQGPAPDEVAERVGRALLAGTLDGWTEDPYDVPDDAPATRPALPSYDHRDLKAALSGWESRTRVPNTRLLQPCLSWPEAPRGGAGGEGSDPSGLTYGMVGYPSRGSLAREQVARNAAELESCPDVDVTRRDLGDGVSLFTYDLGTSGHGAIWLAANDDRAMYVSQENASGPMHAEVGPLVAEWMSEVLALPWPEPR